MGPYFMKGDLDLPTQNKSGNDLCGLNVLIGAEQRLWIELAFWVTNEDPPDGNRCHPRIIPKSRSRSDLNLSLHASIPGNNHRLPYRVRINQTHLQRWLACSFEARSSRLPGL